MALIPLGEYLEMALNGEILDSKTGHLLLTSLRHILNTDAKTLVKQILA